MVCEDAKRTLCFYPTLILPHIFAQHRVSPPFGVRIQPTEPTQHILGILSTGIEGFHAIGAPTPRTATEKFQPLEKQKSLPPTDERGNLKESSTANKMHPKWNTLQDLARVAAHRGCADLEHHQQLIYQRNGSVSLNIPATGTPSQNTSNTTETQAYMERETSPTSISPVDLQDSFWKDTDTVMGVYGSDSIHSSNSDDSTDFNVQRTASLTKVDTILVKEIGSHLVQGDTGNGPHAHLNALSPVQYNETYGFSEAVGRRYGENLDVSSVSVASSHQCSPNVLSRGH